MSDCQYLNLFVSTRARKSTPSWALLRRVNLKGVTAVSPKAAGEPVEEAFADAGGVADEVGDLPVLEIGEELVGEGWLSLGFFEVLAALVGEDVDGGVDGAGLGVFGRW